MSPNAEPEKPAIRVKTAGAVVRDETGRMLLIRRGRAPSAGLWSIPGGRLEAGESAAEAVLREVSEETGLMVEVLRVGGAIELPGAPGVVYDNVDFVCRPVGGTLQAGDDAAEVGWFTDEQARALPTTPGLLEALASWGLFGA